MVLQNNEAENTELRMPCSIVRFFSSPCDTEAYPQIIAYKIWSVINCCPFFWYLG